jgi:hypothetical protein
LSLSVLRIIFLFKSIGNIIHKAAAALIFKLRYRYQFPVSERNVIFNLSAAAVYTSWEPGRPLVREVLWFLNSQFSKMTKSKLSSLMSPFCMYEVAAAKCLLFEFAKSMKVDYLPVFTERKGTNKIRAATDDTLSLFTLHDVHKVELPCYVVMDIRRVPALDSKVAVDLSVVATSTAIVNGLRQQVSVLSDK